VTNHSKTLDSIVAPVRRIVTTKSVTGRSRVLFDSDAPQTITVLTELWRTGVTDLAVDADASLGSDRLDPPKGGSVFRFFEIAPASQSAHLTAGEKEAAAESWFKAMHAGHNRVDTRRDPNMHLSATTDYIILLKGQITLVLDDEEVRMKPFDTVVQRQTNHAWRNDGTETALLVAVLVDES
jgi:mannose-6-phosphate isomerase-like protein (cupin superfamily)